MVRSCMIMSWACRMAPWSSPTSSLMCWLRRVDLVAGAGRRPRRGVRARAGSSARAAGRSAATRRSRRRCRPGPGRRPGLSGWPWRARRASGAGGRLAGRRSWARRRRRARAGGRRRPAGRAGPRRVTSMRISLGEKVRGSTVCTTRTPWRAPPSTSGTPRNEWYGSSPASGKYLKRGWAKASAHHDRPELLGDEAGQPLVAAHAHPADGLRLQADRGAEDEFAALGFEEVDGADGGVEAALDQADDVVERLRGVVAVDDELGDLVQREQEGVFVAGCGLVHGVMCSPPAQGIRIAGRPLRCEALRRMRIIRERPPKGKSIRRGIADRRLRDSAVNSHRRDAASWDAGGRPRRPIRRGRPPPWGGP